MPIDENSQPYLWINENGSKVKPEAAGWQKGLVFRGVFGKQKIYTPIEGRPTQLKVSESYVWREYAVKAPKCALCDLAISKGKIAESACRIRKISLKTGLVHRCFLGAIASKSGLGSDWTELFMNYDDTRHWKLLKEEPISREAILEKFKQGICDYISDFDLIYELETRLGVNF